MARYVDADKIDYRYGVDVGPNLGGLRAIALKSDIDNIPPADVIPIPDRATNGDILMTMFPNAQTREVCNGELIEFTLDGVVGITITKEWWNASYSRK